MHYAGKTGDKNKLSVSLIIIGGMMMILWLLFVWGTSLLKTRQTDEAIAQFQEENRRLLQLAAEKEARAEILESAEYKAKWAKEHQNKVMSPNEHFIVLPSENELSFEERLKGLSERERKIEILKTRPNREQWWEFFFGERV